MFLFDCLFVGSFVGLFCLIVCLLDGLFVCLVDCLFACSSNTIFFQTLLKKKSLSVSLHPSTKVSHRSLRLAQDARVVEVDGPVQGRERDASRAQKERHDLAPRLCGLHDVRGHVVEHQEYARDQAKDPRDLLVREAGDAEGELEDRDIDVDVTVVPRGAPGR